MAASNWDQRYLEGSDRWELGKPAPPLEAFLRTGRQAPQPPGRVLVPGCGRGHEAALLADLGYEVTGLDFSSEAIQRARRCTVPIAPSCAGGSRIPAGALGASEGLGPRARQRVAGALAMLSCRTSRPCTPKPKG